MNNNINKKYKSNKLRKLNSNNNKSNKEKNNSKHIKNLHIIVDNFYSRRLIEFVNMNFDKNKHVFALRETEKLKYIDPQNYANVKRLDLKDIKNLSDMSKKVFIHFLKDDFVKIIDRCEGKNKFYWIIWGADLYNYIDIDLYGESTKEFLVEKNLKNVEEISRKAKKPRKNYKQRLRVIKKISYILATAKGDYNLVKSNYDTNAKYIPFAYPNPIDFATYDKECEENISNSQYDFKKDYKYVILLGNSGYETNNHLDILYKLKDIDSKEFCVVVPLSYGKRKYIEELILKGKELLGEQFIPLKAFLKPEEYIAILNQVDIGIMNHKRQQGMENINLLLYLGKKVYMNEEVTYYSYLQEIGVKVFSISEINISSLKEMFAISEDCKKINKEAIKEFFGDKKVKEYMSKVFEQ